MASKVNRWTVSLEDFFLLTRRYLRNLLTCTIWSAPLFSMHGVTAAGLHQTANQGRSRPALRLGRPAAGPLACAFENHAFPTSALQSVAIALPRAVAVRCQLDARAAAGQGHRGPILPE